MKVTHNKNIPAPGPISVLRGHTDGVSSVRFVENQLVSGSFDGEIRVWNLNERVTKSRIAAHDDSILSLGTNSNNNLLSCGRDECCKLWDIEMNVSTREFFTGSKTFCGASISSNIIITPSFEENEVIIWDLRQSNPVNKINDNSYSSNTPSVASSNISCGMITKTFLPISSHDCPCSMLYLGYESGSLGVLDFRSITKGCRYPIFPSSPIFAIEMSSSDSSIYVAGADSSIQAVNLFEEKAPSVEMQDGHDSIFLERSGTVGHLDALFSARSSNDKSENQIISSEPLVLKKHVVKHSHILSKPGVNELSLRSDSKILISGQWDKTVRVFQRKNLKPLAILSYHRDSISSVCFPQYSSLLPLQNLFVSGSKDGTIALWNLYS